MFGLHEERVKPRPRQRQRRIKIERQFHKLARRVSKDSVTSPLRAPFTRYEGLSGPAELQEGGRGSGIRKAVGELVSCPFCLSQWVATGFVFGLLMAPRATRWTASVFASLALADFVQFAYAWAEQQAGG